MKKTVLLFAAAGMMLASCQDAPKADQADATAAQTVAPAAATAAVYKADVGQSKIEFVGTKPTGKHHGTLAIKEGSLSVENGAITAGSFVVDMSSVKADDQDSAKNAMLGGHLMSPDFFDAAKFGTGTFQITAVTAGVDSSAKAKDATHTVTGNLNLKGISKSITFPARVNMTDATITTDANFNIDRKEWGIGEVASLKDKLISPTVNITLHIVAVK
jgi:polyisoprenoid-binding protein YceI